MPETNCPCSCHNSNLSSKSKHPLLQLCHTCLLIAFPLVRTNKTFILNCLIFEKKKNIHISPSKYLRFSIGHAHSDKRQRRNFMAEVERILFAAISNFVLIVLQTFRQVITDKLVVFAEIHHIRVFARSFRTHKGRLMKTLLQRK